MSKRFRKSVGGKSREVSLGSTLGGKDARKFVSRRPLRFELLELRAMLTTAVGDFNGDGFADLAVGTPEETLSDGRSGLVNIAYGSAEGLNDSDDPFDPDDEEGPPPDFISQDRRFSGTFVPGEDTSDIDGESEFGDQFGYSLAAGDFNGDGFDDLAVGVPFEDFPDEVDAGAVNILYGSATGLTTRRSLFLHQDIEGVGEVPETGDRFGFSLAAGDFDGDGFDDLAVGVPHEDVGKFADAGIVQIFRGSNVHGLNRIRDEIWSQNKSGISDSPESNDRFGYSLIVGNFNGDRGDETPLDDLAIGVPFEDIRKARDCGAINVIYGSDDGLASRGNHLIGQGLLLKGRDRILGASEGRDRFGFSLATGSIDNDGVGSGGNRRTFDELVVGVPHEDLATSGDPGGLSLENAGGINVIFGSRDGLVGDDNQFFSLNTQEVSNAGVIIGQIEGESNGDDLFGFSVAISDFDGDGFGDVAVGAPRRGTAAGTVTIIFGRGYGLTARGDDEFFGSNFTAGDFEEFATAMAVGDFDDDGFGDLFITIPGRDVDIDPAAAEDIKEDLGSALLLYGGNNPFQFGDTLDQRTLGGGVGSANDDSEQNDRFGGRSKIPDFE